MLDPDISTEQALRHLHRAAPSGDAGLDRRRFLQLVGMGFGAGLVSGPGTTLFDSALPWSTPVASAAPLGADDGILVVLGLYGGNDGLNTTVALDDAHYRDQHGPLAIAPDDTLRLDTRFGLHPALGEVKRRWDQGDVAIVEGVGHGLDDFSHFASLARWMAGRPTGIPDTGWLGRWLDEHLDGRHDLFAAAEIGTSIPLHLTGRFAAGTTVPAGRPDFGLPRTTRAETDAVLFDTIRSFGPAGATALARRVGAAQADQLVLAERVTPFVPAVLPTNEVVAKAEVCARLINANLGFRVLTMGWADFDTHAGQPDQHAARLGELDAALTRLFAVLDPAWVPNVTVMTYSEFGRTSWSNDGAGTDHGSAGPQFVIGDRVRGGWYGERPALKGLRRWERMATHVDLRDYYGTVLEGVLGMDASTVLPGAREDLGIFTTGPSSNPSLPPPVLSTFHPLPPERIFDSRGAIGGRTTPIGPGETVRIPIASVGSLPAHITAVAVNVTAIRPTHKTYLTAYPSGFDRPPTATLNPRPGIVRANASMLGVGSDGSIEVFNRAGHVHVTLDVMGYFSDGPAAGGFVALPPARILDTRAGNGAPKAPLRGGASHELRVEGRGGLPAAGVTAVVLNVTAVRPSENGYVTAWPAGGVQPTVANLSYRAGSVIPNLVVCEVGTNGSIRLAPSRGRVEMTADVVGYFADSGSRFGTVPPERLLDTREGLGASKRRLGPGEEMTLTVGGRGGVPKFAKGVVLNVTAIRPSSQTYLTMYPSGGTRTTTASLNPDAGNVSGNLVASKLGPDGAVTIYNDRGDVDLTADVTGYFM